MATTDLETFADIIEDIGGTPNSFNPIYVNANGILQRVPTGGILNIGGVSGSSFTVNGKAVLLADGSTSDSTDATNAITLQSVYNNSQPVSGAAVLRLTAGKDLVFVNPQNTVQILSIDDFGKVTINGEEFSVNSSIIKLVGTYQEADHWNIVSNDGIKTSLKIEPKSGVAYSTNVVTIKSTNGGAVDLSINKDGDTYIRKLTVGTLNGNTFDFDSVNQLISTVNDLSSQLGDHLSPDVGVNVHQAGEISFTFSADFDSPLDPSEDVHSALTILGYVAHDADVQILDLNSRLNSLQASFDAFLSSEEDEDSTLSSQVVSIGIRVTNLENTIDSLANQIATVQSTIEQFNTIGIEYKQLVASEAWVISHNKNTSRIQFSIYDSQNRIVIPDDAFVLDDNTFIVVFGSPQLGKAMLSCFVEPVEVITNEDSDYSEPIVVPSDSLYYY